MNNANTVIIEGNLVRDCELKYTGSGAAVAAFSLASNRSYKRGDEWVEDTCYVDVKVWGKGAEPCKALAKGQHVCIIGRLSYQHWQGKDGVMHNKLEIVAEKVFKIYNEAGRAPDTVASAEGEPEDFGF